MKFQRCSPFVDFILQNYAKEYSHIQKLSSGEPKEAWMVDKVGFDLFENSNSIHLFHFDFHSTASRYSEYVNARKVHKHSELTKKAASYFNQAQEEC